jgi:3-oxoadipate enol-lactonase
MQSVQANGIKIAYDSIGDGKPPLVFIHGFPFNRNMWRPQMEGMAAKSRLISIDLRGYGQSQRSTEQYTIDLLASDLIAFFDALHIEKAIGCGLSMGGYVLMKAATQFPERFAGIVLADTQCIADSDENRNNRYKGIDTIENKGLPVFVDGMLPKLLSESALKENTAVTEEVKRMMLAAKPESVTDTLKALAERTETCNALKSLRLPAMIICGSEDGVTPMSQSELMNNAIKGSQLRKIDGAGHMSNLEKPGEFNKYLGEFLGSL